MTYKKIRKPWFYMVSVLIALNSQCAGMETGLCKPVNIWSMLNFFAVIWFVINMFSDIKWEAKAIEAEVTLKIKRYFHYPLQILVVSCFFAGFFFNDEAYFSFVGLCSIISGIIVGGIINHIIDCEFYKKISVEK